MREIKDPGQIAALLALKTQIVCKSVAVARQLRLCLISNPLYLLVAGSFMVIGSQSPVVPTFKTPADKILSKLDSAFKENGNRANIVAINNFFILSNN